MLHAHLYFSRCASERERSERERCASSRVPFAISRFFAILRHTPPGIPGLDAIFVTHYPGATVRRDRLKHGLGAVPATWVTWLNREDVPLKKKLAKGSK